MNEPKYYLHPKQAAWLIATGQISPRQVVLTRKIPVLPAKKGTT